MWLNKYYDHTIIWKGRGDRREVCPQKLHDLSDFLNCLLNAGPTRKEGLQQAHSQVQRLLSNTHIFLDVNSKNNMKTHFHCTKKRGGGWGQVQADTTHQNHLGKPQ